MAVEAEKESKPKHVIIIGAGLVGSLAAVYFANRGYKVDLFERRNGTQNLIKDLRNEPFVRGRSINLALSTRGISALEKIGVSETILKDGIPMFSRMIHVGTNNPTPQQYGLYGEAIYSIDRRKLNEFLLSYAESNPDVTVHFAQNCLQIDFDNCKETGERKEYTADFFIGADGAYSAVRKEIMKKTRMNFSQEYVCHGYKELTIFPKNDTFAMESNCLHIWPRKKFMMIALPNQDCTFTCTLFFPFELFEFLNSEEKVVEFFEREFPDAIGILGKENLVREYFGNPVGPLVTMKASPYNYKGRGLIIGDAAHAMVPFYGQGMNAGFEDVEILDSLFNTEMTVEEIFSEFSRKRYPQAVSICELAINNYYEMSSSVISPMFLFKKEIYKLLHYLFPKKIIPLYTMVAFTKLPYDQVVKKRDQQETLVNRLLYGFSGFTLMGIVATGLFIKHIWRK